MVVSEELSKSVKYHQQREVKRVSVPAFLTFHVERPSAECEVCLLVYYTTYIVFSYLPSSRPLENAFSCNFVAECCDLKTFSLLRSGDFLGDKMETKNVKMPNILRAKVSKESYIVCTYITMQKIIQFPRHLITRSSSQATSTSIFYADFMQAFLPFSSK